MKFPYERAATILAECEIFGDTKTSQRWDISKKTIGRYRKRMESDEQLSSLVLQKRKLLASNWSLNTTKCLNSSLEELISLVEDRESDSRRILAITNLVKVVGELRIAADVLEDD